MNLKQFTTMLDDAGIAYRRHAYDGELTIIVKALAGPCNSGDDGASCQFVFNEASGQLLAFGAFGALVEERSISFQPNTRRAAS